MIVTTQKPLDEVLDFISPYKSILVVGCDGCTQPPRGIREARTLAQLLELGGKLRGRSFAFKATTVAKQCDPYLTASALKPQKGNEEAIVSMACGIGVQTLAELFPGVPVFPGQDTQFMGSEEREAGSFIEKCGGCGSCLLALTGGVCPVVRCSKGLLSGACGGAKLGKCEASPEKDCGWVLIYERLKALGKLDNLKQMSPARDFRVSGWKVAA